MDQGRGRSVPYSGDRHHRFCHEGRRGKNQAGRMRGLCVETDLYREIPRNRARISPRTIVAKNRTAAIAFRSIMPGIDCGIASWPMERPEIAEMDPRS